MDYGVGRKVLAARPARSRSCIAASTTAGFWFKLTWLPLQLQASVRYRDRRFGRARLGKYDRGEQLQLSRKQRDLSAATPCAACPLGILTDFVSAPRRGLHEVLVIPAIANLRVE